MLKTGLLLHGLLIFIFICGATILFGQSADSVTYHSDAVSEITALTSSAKKQYVSESWSTHNGLPVNNINDVYQTPDGYLWLATFSGLIRFDGVRFVEFNSGNTENLPSNRILLIQGDEGNSFWLTTELGSLIHVDNGTFTRFEGIPEWEKHYIMPNRFSEDTWVGSVGGLYSFDGSDLTPTRTDLFNGQTITSILYSKSDDLWVVSNSGKAFRFPEGDIQREPIVIEISAQNSTLIEDKQGRVWVGERQLGFIENDRYTPLEINQDYLDMQNVLAPLIFKFIDTPDNQLLVSSQLGLMKIDDNNQLVAIDISSPDEYSPIASIFGNALTSCPDGSVWSLSQNSVYKDGNYEFSTNQDVDSIYCDLEQNLWFTSYRSGLMRYRLSLFESITFKHSDNNFYGIYTDSYNNLWIGKMFGELNRIDAQSNLERYKTPQGWAATSSFIELSDGSFIVGNQRCRTENRTASGGCREFHYIDEEEVKNISAFYEDRENNLWAGTQAGKIRLRNDETGDLFMDLQEGAFPVRFFLEADDGAIWSATTGGGVMRYMSGDSRYYNIADGLSSNNIRSLYQDDYGFIWVGSEDRGLNRIDPATGDIVTISKSDGLYEEGLHTMLLDNSDRMWFSTNRGIFWVNFSDLQEFAEGRRNRIYSTAYTERDGMLNREANGGFQNSGLKTEDGRLWFTTQEEILIVNPDEISVSQPLPGVVIESAVSDGISLVDENRGIIIKPDQRSFSITFSSPVFNAPERVRFRYMLSGFDRDWVDAINRREAIYTNVPAGEYEFRVVAYIDSEFSETEETIAAVTVSPTFIETAWFYAIIIILLVLLVGSGYQIRVRQLVKREKELAKLVDDRTEALRSEKKVTEAQAEQLKKVSLEKDRFFANISHEFRTPLTLTIGPLKDLKDGSDGILSPGAYQKVNLSLRNAQRLLRLVGQLLDLAQFEADLFRLNPKKISLNHFLGNITSRFVGAAERHIIEFTSDIPDQIILVSADSEHFEKAISNLLSNAFKFTPQGGRVVLKLFLSADKENAVISVKDTGSGIEEDAMPRLFDRFYQGEKSEMQPGSGIGLALVKEITELHGGSVHVNSTPGQGAEFIITMPAAAVAGFEDETMLPLNGNSFSYSHSEEDFLDYYDASSTNEKTEVPANDDRKTILLVDDNRDIRAYIREQFSDEYRVIEAESGNRAAAKIKAELPDIIISDVMMPDGDGFELLTKIRENPETTFLPVILLTARAEAEKKLEGLEIGADDYLTKPFSMEEVSVRVHNLIARQMRLQKHYQKQGGNKGHTAITIHPDPAEAVSRDQEYLEEVRRIIQSSMHDEDFSVETLAEGLHQSRTQLYRQVGELTNETPAAIIKRMRLERAAELIQKDSGSIAEIAYSSGFRSVAQFSTSFRNHFGKTPTQFATQS